MFELDHQAEKEHAPGFDVSELLKKPYLTESEAAAITGRSVFTLRNERHLRRGIPYLKISARSVRYKTADVIATMEARRISFEG
ncbi:MAG: hypothetical protein KBG09_05035 [Syntrophobacterales bacterium]|jgi:hypothetical protein|nr:hypothetical protein [Syntrophobacterales bacterium]